MEEGNKSLKVKIMRCVEVPLLTRCCFCFPLRRGLIAIAYINLLIPLYFLISLIVVFGFEDVPDTIRIQMDSTIVLVDLILESVFQFANFILTIILIVGLHKKKVVLMKWYLYTGIGFLLVDIIFGLVDIQFYPYNLIMAFLAIILVQTYTLILVWSSVVKISRDGAVKYTRSEDQV